MVLLIMYVRVFISLKKILGKIEGNFYWVFEINKFF